MLKTVTLATNPFDPSTWTRHEVEDLSSFLVGRFQSLPSTARIYHGEVANDCDVTPSDDYGVRRLESLPGPFYVVVYPAEPATIIIAVVAVAAAIAAAYFFRPEMPTVAVRNTDGVSPNNDLSARANRARVNGRIPDIYGTVRSTPDLVAQPYSIFTNNMQIEYAFMCVGRGEYDVSDVRDGATLLQAIRGSGAAVYGPGTSPNFGVPQLTVGEVPAEPLRSCTPCGSVDGQTLMAPNTLYEAHLSVRFYEDGTIELRSTATVDFTELFTVGSTLVLDGANWIIEPEIVEWIYLNGSYTILAVTSRTVNVTPDAEWLKLGFYDSNPSAWRSPVMSQSGDQWIGPFLLDRPTTTHVVSNFSAPNSLYKDDGTTVLPFDITVELEMTPVDAAGTPTGAAVAFQLDIDGSAAKSSLSSSLITDTLPASRYSVRARRVTGSDTAFVGQIADVVKWRDLYAAAFVTDSDFGDVTTVYTVARATTGALAVKERKINLLASRKIRTIQADYTLTTGLSSSSRMCDILAAVCLDPFIGGRQVTELDLANFYDTQAAVEAYFGSALAGQFNYTIDAANLSFEETVSMVTSAAFCLAFRRGSTIRVSFERSTPDSVLLFNHRNKIPGTEIRTVRFGNLDGTDGVELDYVDPTDDALVTLYLPEDQSAIKAKKVESVGVRSKLQAYFHAWRAWNKIRYQNTSVEFEATQEADLLVLRDRILVADNTRPEVIDGEVTAQNVLELTLSQPVTLAGGSHTIFLQLSDGTVESMSVTNGSLPGKVVLARAPRLSLSLNRDSVRSTFAIVTDSNPTSTPFLVTEKDPRDNFTSVVRSVNYDDRYYSNDDDFLTGVVDVNGNLL